MRITHRDRWSLLLVLLLQVQAHVTAAPTGSVAVAASTSNGAEAGHQLVADGLSIDIVAAEAAARPAAALPSQYATKGVIDPQSPLFSDNPGVLVPLAQGKSPVGDWLAAVEAAGPGTPLSDPMFVGTVFIPNNEAFEELYPELRLAKLQGRPLSAPFSNISTATLALQLNCLTVPGAALEDTDLQPGRLMRTAGFGAIRVISSSAPDKPVRLQHLPSGVYLSILESNLQSGNAVGHVVDVLPPPSVLSKVAVASQEPHQTLQYSSVMMALLDPVRHLSAFAWLVQHAEAEGCILRLLLESSTDAFTLFAPTEQAMAALMASLPVPIRQRLLTNASLADQFISSHLVLGTALGSKALEALLPAGQLKTPQGSLQVTAASEEPLGPKLPAGAVAIIEAGKLKPAASAGAAVAASAAAPANTTGPAASAASDVDSAAAATAATKAAPVLAPEAAPTPAAALVMQEAPLHVSDTAWPELPVDQDPSLPTETTESPADAPDQEAPPTPPTDAPPTPAPAALPTPTAAAPGAGIAAAAAPADTGAPVAALGRSQVLTVGGAAVVARDMMGGKAVLHVVDRVLISPELSAALGLPSSPGYSPPEANPPAAASSARHERAPGIGLPAVVAAVCLLLLL